MLSDIQGAYEKRCIACDFGRAFLMVALMLVFVLMLFGNAKSQPQPQLTLSPPQISLWQHSTSPQYGQSLMRMVLTGGTHVDIVYDAPRPTLLEIGVRPGTPFFSGDWRGDTLVGYATVFKYGCSPVPYLVQGGYIGEGVIRLTGAAPRFGYGCDVLGLAWYDHNTVLDFFFVGYGN